jgi:hypothetical protein
LSDDGSTHWPPQRASPEMQLVEHWPPEHACPLGHTTPHAPQLTLSVSIVVQMPLQSVSAVRLQTLDVLGVVWPTWDPAPGVACAPSTPGVPLPASHALSPQETKTRATSTA